MHVFSQSSFFRNLFRFPPHPPQMNFSHKPLSLLKKNIRNRASQPPDSLLRLQRAGRPTLAGLPSFFPEVKFNITLSNIIKPGYMQSNIYTSNSNFFHTSWTILFLRFALSTNRTVSV